MSQQHFQEIKASPDPVLKPIGDAVTSTLFKSDLSLLVLLLVTGLIVSNISLPKKGILADARFGERWEKLTAVSKAQQQIQQGKPDGISLAIGMYEGSNLSAKISTLLTGEMPFLPLVDVQESGVIAGAPNSGKSFSFFLPAIRSAIRQGKPIVVFDIKGELAKALAAFAVTHEYEVYFFAPGQKHSGRINLLDFMANEEDSAMAEQMAIAINRNANLGGLSKTDPFFGPSGDKLARSIFMLAKGTEYPDLVMAKRLLSLSDLPNRLNLAEKEGKINPFVLDSFQQFRSGEKSEKTVASIQTTASLVFDSFTRPEFMSYLVGKSTIPLDFYGKKILFLQPDPVKGDVILPVIAAILDLFMARNFAVPRKEGLFLFLDEFAMFFLPNVYKWVNLFRSYGLSCWLGYQNFAQVRDKYGADRANAVFSACGTKIWFNPRDAETAEAAAKYLSDKEVISWQQSRSHGKGGRSTSASEQRYKVPLWSAKDFSQMDKGECIVINSGFRRGKKIAIPIHTQIHISQSEQDLQKECENLWNEVIYHRLCEQMAELHLPSAELRQLLQQRATMAEAVLSLETEESEPPRDSTIGILSDELENYAEWV
jgi:type IV secretory pathway TraG/TraD family ATPase VirD4